MARRPTTNVSDLDAYRKGERGARISTQDPSTSFKVSQNTIYLRRVAAGITAVAVLGVLGGVGAKIVDMLPASLYPANGVDDASAPGSQLALETFENNNSTRISQTLSIFENMLSEDGKKTISDAANSTVLNDKAKVAEAFNLYYDMAKYLENKNLLNDKDTQRELFELGAKFDALLGQPGVTTDKHIGQLASDLGKTNEMIEKINNYFGINTPVVDVQVKGISYQSDGGRSIGN